MATKKDYSIANISVDAVIACSLGGVSLIATIASIIVSILQKGQAGKIFGYLCVAGFLLSICGIFFFVSAWRSEDGMITMKRVAGILTIVAFLLGLFLLMVGIF